MDRAKTPGRVATALIASVLLMFIAAMTAAVVDDYLQRDALPAGATVAGAAVGGLAPAEAARVIEQQVTAPLLTPITFTFRDATAEVEPSMFTTVDMDAILESAAAPKLSATLPQRVWWRVTGASYGTETTEVIKVDPEKISAWLALEKKLVSVPAVDASMSVTGSKLRITPAQPGVSFDTTAAAAALSEALVSGGKTVRAVETTTSPKITDAKLGKTIFVSRSKKTLVLYNGTKVEKKYRCAVGTPEFPTPVGTFKIVLKRYLPTWSNPGSAWAVDMPAYIGPGPGNPLGTRALNIDSPGIRIHGTSKDYSIGTAASHGCMRMHMWDIEDLYERVKVGTRVIIVS